MVGGVPLIHGLQFIVTLMDGDDRTLGQLVEFAVGDNGGDFDDPMLLGNQTGHLHIYPD